jgi:hypothetical protein
MIYGGRRNISALESLATGLTNAAADGAAPAKVVLRQTTVAMRANGRPAVSGTGPAEPRQE